MNQDLLRAAAYAQAGHSSLRLLSTRRALMAALSQPAVASAVGTTGGAVSPACLAECATAFAEALLPFASREGSESVKYPTTGQVHDGNSSEELKTEGEALEEKEALAAHTAVKSAESLPRKAKAGGYHSEYGLELGPLWASSTIVQFQRSLASGNLQHVFPSAYLHAFN